MSKTTTPEIPLPNKRYILSNLLVKRSVAEITKECQTYNLDIPSSDTIARYQKFLADKVPFNPDAPDFDVLLENKLYHMVAYYLLESGTTAIIPMSPIGVEGAFRILEDNHMRRIITALSLANMQNEDIDLIINARYNHNYDPEEVRLFVQFFCDFSNFKISEKQNYVNNIQDKLIRKNYSYALQNDKNMLLWKLGLAPDKSFDAMLRDIGVDCYYNYKEQLGINDQAEAQKWATLLLKVQERIDKLDEGDTNKHDLFSSFLFSVQSQKANTQILPPDKVQIEMPIYETADARTEIISVDELERASNVTVNNTTDKQNTEESN